MIKLQVRRIEVLNDRELSSVAGASDVLTDKCPYTDACPDYTFTEDGVCGSFPSVAGSDRCS